MSGSSSTVVKGAGTFSGADRRRLERRHRLDVEHEMRKLGWCVVDTDNPVL